MHSMLTNVHKINDERHMIISMAIVETIDKIQQSVMIKTIHTLIKEKIAKQEGERQGGEQRKL